MGLMATAFSANGAVDPVAAGSSDCVTVRDADIAFQLVDGSNGVLSPALGAEQSAMRANSRSRPGRLKRIT